MAPGEYERRRDEQKLRNQAKLVELGLVKLLTKMPAPKAAKRARPAAAPAAPSRASGRLAAAPKVSYKPTKAVLPSDDDARAEQTLWVV